MEIAFSRLPANAIVTDFDQPCYQAASDRAAITAETRELSVDRPNLKPAGAVGLQPVRYLQQFPDSSIDAGERALFHEFHRACRMVI
jgi:hypothetical protein